MLQKHPKLSYMKAGIKALGVEAVVEVHLRDWCRGTLVRSVPLHWYKGVETKSDHFHYQDTPSALEVADSLIGAKVGNFICICLHRRLGRIVTFPLHYIVPPPLINKPLSSSPPPNLHPPQAVSFKIWSYRFRVQRVLESPKTHAYYY